MSLEHCQRNTMNDDKPDYFQVREVGGKTQNIAVAILEILSSAQI
jgi:hypothetical protein